MPDDSDIKRWTRSGLVLAALAAWLLWLRWPGLSATMWDLDEGIHAAVGRVILEGGVMYRDAIDQRTPLTYHVAAGVYAVAGVNNQFALRAVLAVLLAAAAHGLFLFGRRHLGEVAGAAAALFFACFVCAVPPPTDAFSINTESFLVLFSVWAAVALWREGTPRRFGAGLPAGVLYGAAFLCKQPGLLDGAAAFAAVLWLGLRRHLHAREMAAVLGGLAVGWLGVVGASLAYFHLHGALADYWFHAWTYNLVYYGAATSLSDRLGAAAHLWRLLGGAGPAVLAMPLAGACVLLYRALQHRTPDAWRSTQPVEVFMIAWLLLAWAGSAASGRTFGHYYVQAMPALALAGGWFAQAAWHAWRSTARASRLAAGLVLLTAAWAVMVPPVRARGAAPPAPDVTGEAAELVRALSTPAETVFAWGFHPDFYLYANRPPASRYLYCSFQTGLVPWINTADDRDTRDTAVPGAMETLLQDLARRRPGFILDTSGTRHRAFHKYPPGKFPALARLLRDEYTEVEPARLRPLGLRLFRRNDAADREPPPPPAGPAPAAVAIELQLAGGSGADREVRVRAAAADGGLQRLALLADGVHLRSLSFAPVDKLTAHFRVTLPEGCRQITARATGAAGRSVDSAPHKLDPAGGSGSALADFVLPVVAAGTGVAPEGLTAPYGAQAREEAGRSTYFAHAPSEISYRLPATATRLRGRFGFRPGAYAPDNAHPTDGAEFSIIWTGPGGRDIALFRRELRPLQNPPDRTEQDFDVPLPGAGTLRLITGPGSAGTVASDWTYWADLRLYLRP